MNQIQRKIAISGQGHKNILCINKPHSKIKTPNKSCAPRNLIPKRKAVIKKGPQHKFKTELHNIKHHIPNQYNKDNKRETTQGCPFPNTYQSRIGDFQSRSPARTTSIHI
jgi:hypothetical protein